MVMDNIDFTSRMIEGLTKKGVDFSRPRTGLKDYAKSAGIPYTTLCKYVKKPGLVPTWDVLLILSQEFGCSIEKLLTGREVARSGTNNPHGSLLKKAEDILTHGDRLSQISLEKAILELHKAVESSNPDTAEESLILRGGTAQR